MLLQCRGQRVIDSHGKTGQSSASAIGGVRLISRLFRQRLTFQALEGRSLLVAEDSEDFRRTFLRYSLILGFARFIAVLKQSHGIQLGTVNDFVNRANLSLLPVGQS